MRRPENLNLYYIYLTVGCGMLGIIITIIVILACQYYAIDMTKNLWVLAIPVGLSLLLNVLFVEVFRKLRR